MNNYNYHPVRWYTTTVATLASFSLWFTWTKQQSYYLVEKTNGYSDWGFVTVAGIVGVFVAAFIGDRTKPFDPNSKLIACASFAAIAIGGIITMATSGTNANTGIATKTGPGPWIAIVLAVIGLILSTGILKLPNNFPSSFNQAPPTNIPPPPPPPPPASNN